MERGHLLLVALMPNPVTASIFRALCNITEGLTRTNIRAHEEELLGLKVSQAEKDIALSKCVSSQQSCAAKKPKLTSNAISDVNDLPNFDPDGAAHRLCQHWSSVVGARCTNIPNDPAQMILPIVQPAPRELIWSIGLDEFEELLASKRDSAPDPDGLPNRVCRCAGGSGPRCRVRLSHTALVPAERSFFFPKTRNTNDRGLVIRSLRRLTLRICDCGHVFGVTYVDTLSNASTRPSVS